MKVEVFRGHPSDLVDRYYEASKFYEADVVVRIPADNPLIHPSEIDRIVSYYLDSNLDFASNLGPFLDNQYPDGLGAEVFSFDLLQKIYREVDDLSHREHVTSFLRENPDQFRLGSVKCPEEFRRPDIVLDINTIEEYEFIEKLFKDLSRPGELIHISQIIPWYDRQENNPHSR